MNQKPKTNLFLFIKDFSLHIHMFAMTAKLFTPQPPPPKIYGFLLWFSYHLSYAMFIQKMI